MQVEELQLRLKTQFDRLAEGLSEADAAELEEFVNGLTAKPNRSLANLTKELEKRTQASEPAQPKNSAKVDSALKTFRALEAEIETWETPDYEKVRPRVQETFESLTKTELAQVSEVLLGKRNSSLSKAKMISQLCYGPIRQLEVRFMNVRA